MESMQDESELITPREAAAMAKVTRATIATWAREGHLAHSWGVDSMGQKCRKFTPTAVQSVMAERDLHGGRLAPRRPNTTNTKGIDDGNAHPGVGPGPQGSRPAKVNA